MKKSSRAVIYARVSSTGDRQDTERQVADCLAFLRKGGADTLLLSELSRLGRSVRKILDLNIDTMLPDGTENPVAKMLLTVLGLGAEIERKNIVSRLYICVELRKKPAPRGRWTMAFKYYNLVTLPVALRPWAR